MLYVCILLFNQRLKGIPTQVLNQFSVKVVSLVFWPTRTSLPHFPKFQIQFPYLSDTFLLHLGRPPRDMVQRVLSRQNVRTTGLISCLSQLSEIPIFAVCFPLSENSCLCLSTFLVIYDRKASSVAVIPLEPEAEFYRMHFTR